MANIWKASLLALSGLVRSGENSRANPADNAFQPTLAM